MLLHHSCVVAGVFPSVINLSLTLHLFFSWFFSCLWILFSLPSSCAAEGDWEGVWLLAGLTHHGVSLEQACDFCQELLILPNTPETHCAVASCAASLL